jgi:peroxiredoxin/predicted 2-oxoglutarate/Fe(II)-dependent dioxygenase YbiX
MALQKLSAGLMPGDPFPHFGLRTRTRAKFQIDTMAGRYLVLCFYGSAADPWGRSAINAMHRNRDRFDDQHASFFGISIDMADEVEQRIADSMPGVRFMFDLDKKVSQLCGAMQPTPISGQTIYRGQWVIIDPTLHVLATFPFSSEDLEHQTVFATLDSLPAPTVYSGFELPPPVLILPNVFEPELCDQLIALYEANGGDESGFMAGNRGVFDYSFKRRKDYVLTDPELQEATRYRVARRVNPEIRRLFSMSITHMERYLIGCYDSADGGHFHPHRDNTQRITAHRRFAISVNLNGDFDGGELRFPEYSGRGYKAPPGWAIVFPGAILHAVSHVTQGRRYAFLPFVYDEAGARILQERLAVGPLAEPLDAPEQTPP